MKKEIKYYTLPTSFVAMVKTNPNEEQAILAMLRMIIGWHDGEDLEVPPEHSLIWTVIKDSLELMKQSLEDRRERQRENINKRWNKVVSSGIPNDTNTYQPIPSDTKDTNSYQPIPNDTMVSSGTNGNTNDTYKYKYKDKYKDKEKEIYKEKVMVNSVDRTHDFDVFWEAYNKKVGKAAAIKAYAKATQAKSFPGIERLVDIVYAWRGSRSWREGYQPHPATWLNGERWLDDLNSDSLPTEQEQDNTPPPMLLKTEYHIVEC